MQPRNGPRRPAAALAAGLAVLALSAIACSSSPTPTLSMRLVTPAGLDPRAASALDHVAIRVRETPPGAAAREVVVLEGDAATDFALDFALYSTASRLDVGVDFTGPAAHLLGAAPPFVPDETDGVVDVLVGAPASCALRAGVTLASPRSGAHVARLGSYALLVGGTPSSSAAAARVELIDMLGARPTISDALLVGGASFDASKADVVALSSRAALVLARDRDEALRYDLDAAASARSSAVLVHAGARAGTLVARATSGAAIVGGADPTGAPITDITWVSFDGRTTHGTLAVARRAPAVLALDDGTLLVAGGAERAGAPLLERIAEAAASVPLASTDDDGIRRGASLVSVPSSGGALLLGGLDAGGAPRTDARIFDACPGACTLVEDAELAAPMADATLAAAPGGGALLFGGRDPSGAPTDAQWLVTLAATAPRLVLSRRLPLAAPRASAAALVLPSGVVWLLSGADASGPRDDVDICFPDALALP